MKVDWAENFGNTLGAGAADCAGKIEALPTFMMSAGRCHAVI